MTDLPDPVHRITVPPSEGRDLTVIEYRGQPCLFVGEIGEALAVR